LGKLNPFHSQSTYGTKTSGSSRPKIGTGSGYLRATMKSLSKQDSDDSSEVEAVTETEFSKCINSAGTFVPPYWCFVFSDSNLREYVWVTVNIPSGLCHRKYGLQDKVEANVSSCGTKIIVACEWPSTLVDSSSISDLLTSNIGMVFGSATDNCTKYNILQAFDKELCNIRVANKISTNNMLGSTAVLNLPFRVDQEMCLCQPNLDYKSGSINLNIVKE
jgi:hypothetical protein